MLQINLLPEKQKTEFNYTLKFRLSIFIGIWLSICFIIFLLILIFSNYYLKIQMAAQEKQLDFENSIFENQKIKDLEKISSELNQKFLKVDEVQNQFISFYDVIKSLSLGVPKIRFREIIYMPNTKEINLAAFAPSRDNMLEFKSDLDKNAYFQSVNLPINFLAEQTNINFIIMLKLK